MNATNGAKTEQKKTTGYRTFNKLSKTTIDNTRLFISDIRRGIFTGNRLEAITNGTERIRYALTNRGAERLGQLYRESTMDAASWLEDRLDNALFTQETKFGGEFWNREGV